MKNKLGFLIISCLFTLILVSCKDEYNICNEPRNVKFIGNFYKRIAGADVTTAVTNLTITLPGGTVPVIDAQPNTSSFFVSFDPTKDSIKYILTLGGGLPKDTVTLFYTNTGIPTISPDCGPIFGHNITRATTTINTIDSIVIINPVANTSLSQNAKIYF
jgi:Family of unknown function (DUF6452)